MKILHLSTSDIEGGAARSAYRLHQGLRKIGLDSQMLVRAKNSIDPTVNVDKSLITKLGMPAHSWPLRFYPQRQKKLFSTQWFPDIIFRRVQELNPDIINLNWICNGFIQIETLARFNKPIVWTFHDMWAFTGGCQYTQNCIRYQDTCGSCPQLKSQKDRDLSRRVWQRKFKAWRNLDLHIITPSRWLHDCTKASSLFSQRRVEVIPYGLDLAKYRPLNRQTARDLLGLPQNKKLILFGSMSADDPRKGFELFRQALVKLGKSSLSEQLELVVIGEAKSQKSRDNGFETHYLGRLSDDISLALVYSAADVFVAPSLQDNLPNTILEAIACGTPCVAFDIGGMPDMIEHQINGYLARPFEVEDLAQGIIWILEGKERYQKLGESARQIAEQKYSLHQQAERYSSLYRELIQKTEI